MQTESVTGVVGPNRTRLKTDTDGEIAVMGMEGDVKTIWNPQNTDEVENARDTFAKMRAKGYLAFRVTGDGNQGEQIREFDAAAGKMIMVPPMAGG
jgi:hypothetical protein